MPATMFVQSTSGSPSLDRYQTCCDVCLYEETGVIRGQKKGPISFRQGLRGSSPLKSPMLPFNRRPLCLARKVVSGLSFQDHLETGSGDTDEKFIDETYAGLVQPALPPLEISSSCSNRAPFSCIGSCAHTIHFLLHGPPCITPGNVSATQLYFDWSPLCSYETSTDFQHILYFLI